MESLTKFAKQLNGKAWRFDSGLPARNLVIIDRDGANKPEIQHILHNKECHMELLPHLLGKRRCEEDTDKVHWYIKIKGQAKPITVSAPLSDSKNVFSAALNLDAVMVAVMP